MIKTTKLNKYIVKWPQRLLKRVFRNFANNKFSQKNASETIAQLRSELQKTQEELILFKSIIDHFPEIVLMTDKYGNVKYANSKFEETTGIKLNEIEGENVNVLKSGKTPKETYKHLWDTISKGEIWRGEFTSLNKEGKEYVERVVITPLICNISGKIFYLAAKEDISALKLAQDALSDNERLFKLFLENSNDVIWTRNLNDFKYTYISPSVTKLRGISVKEAMEERLCDTFEQDSFELIENIFKDDIRNYNKEIFELKQTHELKVKNNKGQTIDVEVNASLILDEHGKPKEILGVTRDITKRKVAEHALAENENKFKIIAENTTDVIWVLDLEKERLSYVSPSVIKMRGYSIDEILKQPLSELLTEESCQRAILGFSNLRELFIQDPDAYVCRRYQQPCKDGRIIDIELTASFIKNDSGTLNEIIGVTRDITERIKIEQELAESEERLAKLLKRQTAKNAKLTNQLKSVFNNSFSAIVFFSIDKNKIIVSGCNSVWANTFSSFNETIEGKDISIICDEITAELHYKYIFKAIKAEKPIYEYIQWNDRYLYTCIVPICDEQTNQYNTCGCFVYDVTDKMMAEKRMQESEEKFRIIFENSKDVIVVLNLNLNLVSFNHQAYELLGKHIKPDNKVLEYYVPTKYHYEIIKRTKILEQGLIVPAFECELIRYDGSLIPVEFNSSVITINKNRLILCIIRDVSIRKNLEKTLVMKSIQIENRERRKLAEDLHDNVGPLLSSMNMCVSLLGRKQNISQISEDITDIRKILKEAITAVRDISNNLSPQVLNNFGLVSALEVFFDSKKKIVQVDFTTNMENVRIPEIMEISLYTIIKELYNNTIKYSKADLIVINIQEKEEFISLFYKDNGIGFNLQDKLMTPSANLGLFSIINRIKTLEGIYHTHTSEGNGFVIDIVFPLENKNVYAKN